MEQLGNLMKVPMVGQAMGGLFPLLGLVTVIKQTMPTEGHEALIYCGRAVKGLLNPYCFYAINEFEGSLLNDLYKDVHLHLESCQAYNKAKRVTLFRQPNTAHVTMRLGSDSDVVVDVYKGMTVWWTHHEVQKKGVYRAPYGSGGTRRSFQLKIRKRDKARLLPEYLDFITRNSDTYSGRTREIKIFTNSNGHGFHQLLESGAVRMWEEVPYKHPSTFDTLAIDPGLKEKIITDLTSFTTDQSFYANTGRAWKRGYLLYGPPGTGKSSMIAAMANLLRYDVYDLELSHVRTNGDLRQLLIQTRNRSIIVLEDIDCSVKFTTSRSHTSMMMMPGDSISPEDDQNRVTLSGLLNFVDGLWSCCGHERIFVFTTNHVDKLDKALLRPGRMDMQIELSFCTFPAFKVLARNYLSTQEHPLFPKVEAAFRGKTMTPAQIAELLIKDKRNVDVALESVISALENNVPKSPETGARPDVEDSNSDSKDEGTKMGSVDRGNLIATLQGVIKVLEKDAESVMSPAPIIGSSDMKELVKSIRATLVKNKGDIDSAIEGVIQVLDNKLPVSEIHHIFSVVEPTDHGTSPPELANGSSSQAASNGACAD